MILKIQLLVPLPYHTLLLLAAAVGALIRCLSSPSVGERDPCDMGFVCCQHLSYLLELYNVRLKTP